MSQGDSRPVYSTVAGRLCPTCGWPVRQCACSSGSRPHQPVPARIVAKLRIERKGRGGKTVTIVYDLPQNEAFVKDLCGELKRACGAGGTVVDNTVEIQGDQIARVRALLVKKAWTVKG